MATVILNRCPRCEGYMFLSLEPDGWYRGCLQCSYQQVMSTAVSKVRSTQTLKELLLVEKPGRGPYRRRNRSRLTRPPKQVQILTAVSASNYDSKTGEET
jgi:hypothetical protein